MCARLSISAPGELSDQQTVTESSEIGRSHCHTPGSVQPIAVFEMERTINVHEAKAWAVSFSRRQSVENFWQKASSVKNQP